MSEFWTLVDDEFGRAHARSLAADLALRTLDDRTAERALADGEDPTRVWRALCEAMDVPPERRGGPVPPARRGRRP
ncbi:MAG: DUF3046 domain-containing protein [Kineosporiaceae bacterium]